MPATPPPPIQPPPLQTPPPLLPENLTKTHTLTLFTQALPVGARRHNTHTGKKRLHTKNTHTHNERIIIITQHTSWILVIGGRLNCSSAA